MPEGPEVKHTGDVLHADLSGKYITYVEVNEKSRYNKTSCMFPGMSKLSFPVKIVSVQGRAKKLIFTLQNANGDVLWMVSFLGMEGHWQYERGNHSGVIFNISVMKTIHIEVDGNVQTKSTLKPERVLYYDDVRHHGTIELYDTEKNLMDAFKNIGPDFLNMEVTLEEYTRVIRGSRIKNKHVADFLLEQKYFSGVGNYLRSEILYAARISPFRKLITLTNDDIKLLFEKSYEKIFASYQSNGLTIATYRNPNGKLGTFQVDVYRKDKDPEGNNVVVDSFPVTASQKRSVYWVPEVQQ